MSILRLIRVSELFIPYYKMIQLIHFCLFYRAPGMVVRKNSLFPRKDLYGYLQVQSIHHNIFKNPRPHRRLRASERNIDTLSQFLVWRNIIWFQMLLLFGQIFLFQESTNSLRRKLDAWTWEGGDERTLCIKVITYLCFFFLFLSFLFFSSLTSMVGRQK